MALTIKKVGVIGAGQMGNGIAHVVRAGRASTWCSTTSPPTASKSAMATINGNLARQVAKKIITEDARKQALARIIRAPRRSTASPIATS